MPLWLEKFDDSHFRACYATFTKTQKIVFHHLPETTNLEIMRSQVEAELGHSFSKDNLSTVRFQIRQRINNYIKDHLLTAEELLELRPNGHDRTDTDLILKHNADVLTLISAYRAVFDQLINGIVSPLSTTECELHTIIKSGLTNIEKNDYLRQLINQNPDVINETDEDGCTPLFIAVATDQRDIVELLLGQPNIQIDVASSYGWTPFLKAANMGLLEIAQLLVESGADINKTTRMGANAVYEAAYGCDDLNMIKYLVEELNLDINKPTQDQFTPLLTAIWRRNYQVAKYLIESEQLTSINAMDLKDENAFYKAISQGYYDLVYLLHQKGALFHRPIFLSSPARRSNIDLQMKSFSDCIYRNDFETAQQLIEKQTEQDQRKKMVNQVQSPYDRSLLSIAAENGNLSLVKLLVENGADLFARNNHGRTPKEMVLNNIHPEVYNYLDEEEKRINHQPSAEELRRLYGDTSYS